MEPAPWRDATQPAPWRDATQRALYGPAGFYHRLEGPGGHFRTSVHASPLFAQALVRLVAEVDDALGHPGTLDVVDLGAGRGELLRGLAGSAPPSLRERWRLIGVEVAARPPDLPGELGWTDQQPTGVRGVVIANEWLDNVPVDVAALTGGETRLVLVHPATGAQSPGPPPSGEDLAWLDAWWPLANDGDRAEIGRPRDEAWSRVIGAMERGVAVAVDYGHLLAERVAGAYAGGTLAGYRDGRAVAPVPDGSCDITSHVAMDAVAAAGERAGANATLLTTQRDALRALGVDAARPPLESARSDPRGYLAGLSQAGEAAELIDREGLGAFRWLVQAVGVPLPASATTSGDARP